MGARAALAERLGLSEDEVLALDDFENHPSFSPRERLALRYTHKLMYYAHDDLNDLYQECLKEFTPEEMIELGALIGLNTGFIGHLVHSWNL